MRRGPSIRYLVLLANAFVLLLPVFAFWFLRLWDGHLVRVTEQQLIAEAVLLREAYRDARRASQALPAAVVPVDAQSVAPVLPLDYTLEPPAAAPPRHTIPRDSPAWRAGAAVEPLMRRAGRSNLSAARLLDETGCVVATTGADAGACLDHLPEVRRALRGDYAATARERRYVGPPPALGSLSRRGTVRVFVALPVVEDGAPAGAVLMSRTSSSPLEAVWTLRYTILAGLALCVALTIAVSAVVSRGIVRPVRAITAAAAAVTRGEPSRSLAPSGFVPAEVAGLSDALARMTAQLTERAEYVAEFAANASHELKTPITAIRGAAELLAESWEAMPVDQRRRFLANIDADAARMQRLVSRLLELARIQSVPEAAERVAVAAFFAATAARYGERVRLHLADDAPAHIVIAPQHLETAVHNLIDNGVRHGDGQPVGLSVDGFLGRLRVRVRDGGPGISAANRHRVFDRFFTTERDRGGTGLGLAMVRAVADTRAGWVELDSGPGGTTFTLVL